MFQSLRRPVSLLTNVALLIVVLSAVSPSVAEETGSTQPETGHFIPMLYHSPGSVDDLAVGLWGWPIPCDFDQDGDTDLIVSCGDTPSNGVYLFENPGPADKLFPIFKKPRRISRGANNVQASWINDELHVLTPNCEYPDFSVSGLERPVDLGLNPNPHPREVRGNMWKYVDFNGDGLTDIAVGSDDWTDYGWDNAWDAEGNWTNGPLRGSIYILLNHGSNEQPQYDEPFLLTTQDGSPVETYGWPSPSFADFDQDGDLDLLCGEFRDRFTYFENIGTRTEPVYASPCAVLDTEGNRLTMELEMITPVAFDWNRDGLPDLICGDEDGRVACMIHSGTFLGLGGAKIPLFHPRVYFKQEADLLKFGSLVSPFVFDFDGDGDQDIIAGSAAGFIAFFENRSGPGVEFPTFAEPVRLQCRTEDGETETFRLLAGVNGSIQGPCEEKWGYLTLSVTDWNQDGRPDILLNNIWGRPLWLENLGPKHRPVFHSARPIEVDWDEPQPRLKWGWLTPDNVGEGMERAGAITPPADQENLSSAGILTQWRTTPVAFDFDGDSLTDLAMLDPEGDLVFYQRYRREDGTLGLKPPVKRFRDDQGNALHLTAGDKGRSGRRKIAAGDYDGDGKFDLVMNTADGNVDLYRQIETNDGSWAFERFPKIGDMILEGHSTHPTFCDLNNDGIPELVVGAEDGHFYYMRNTFWKSFEKK